MILPTLKSAKSSRLLQVAGLMSFAAVLMLVAVTRASAHSRPVFLNPGPGAVLSSAPATVEAWFNGELRRDSNWTLLQVSDAQGNRVDTGEAQLSPDRLKLTATLRSGLGPGAYTVTWRTYDDVDNAIFGDCYVFFVGQAAADVAIAAKTRLDGGRDCQRIDVSAANGTPVAGGTPQATSAAGGHSDAEDDGQEGDNTASEGDGGVPAWSLALGVLVGAVIGGAGVRLIGKRAQR